MLSCRVMETSVRPSGTLEHYEQTVERTSAWLCLEDCLNAVYMMMQHPQSRRLQQPPETAPDYP
jgi:hypothetical protein